MNYGYHSYIKHPLKDEIYKGGMSIDKFAREIRVHKDTLKAIIYGRTKRPCGFTIFRISKGLGMDFQEVKKLIEVS